MIHEYSNYNQYYCQLQMNKKEKLPSYVIENKKNLESKSSLSSFVTKKTSTKVSETSLLNKSQSKKLGPTNASSSLSLKKQKEEAIKIDFKIQSARKQNPQSKFVGPTLLKTSSTQRFLFRNALYNKQKTLKLQNERRKQLYVAVADCKFHPQIQKTHLNSIQNVQRSSQNSDLQIFGEEKIQNLGVYQFNYRKKNGQLGYTKKHVSATTNKSVKQLLKQSVERFNLKLNNQQSQENQVQTLPPMRKLFFQDIKYVSGDTLDTQNNLIWITNESDKKENKIKAKANLVNEQKKREDLNKTNKQHSNTLLPQQSFQVNESILEYAQKSKIQQPNEVLNQVNQRKQNKQAIEDIKPIKATIEQINELNNINDISDIVTAEESLNQSDIFSSKFRTKESDLGRDPGEDWFPKNFKKESYRGQEELKRCTIHEQRQEQRSKISIQSNPFTAEIQASKIVQNLTIQQQNKQLIEEEKSKQQKPQNKEAKEQEKPSQNQVFHIGDDQEYIQVAFDIHLQQQIDQNFCNFDYGKINHYVFGDLSLHPKPETETPIVNKSAEGELQNKTQPKSMDISQSQQAVTQTKKVQEQESVLHQAIQRVSVQAEEVKDEPLQPFLHQAIQRASVQAEEVKNESLQPFLHQAMQRASAQAEEVKDEPFQPFIIDDFGNVIPHDDIQVYSIGLCKFLVINEFPEEQACSSQS